MGWPLEIGESCGIGYWAIVQQITKLGSIDYGSWFLDLNLDRKWTIAVEAIIYEIWPLYFGHCFIGLGPI